MHSQLDSIRSAASESLELDLIGAVALLYYVVFQEPKVLFLALVVVVELVYEVEYLAFEELFLDQMEQVFRPRMIICFQKVLLVNMIDSIPH
jgi:hypothetical protein